MKKSFSKLFLAPLTVLVLASFALAPVAEAARGWWWWSWRWRASRRRRRWRQAGQ